MKILKDNDLVDTFDWGLPDELKYTFWPDRPIAVWDVETNSVEYGDQSVFRITQFACGIYGFHEKKPREFVNIYINPEMAVGYEAMRITGLYQSEFDTEKDIAKVKEYYRKKGKEIELFDLADSPVFADVVEDILTILSKAPIWCAFNHRFDVNALASELHRLNMWLIEQGSETFPFPFRPTVDPLVFERDRRSSSLTNKMSGNRLGDVGRRYGVATVAALKDGKLKLHSAEGDIQMLNDVLWAIQPQIPPDSVSAFRNQRALYREQQVHLYLKYDAD
jgi:DNA polymerase III epsilon subunit-like protein